jgi:hypothetical protein
LAFYETIRIKIIKHSISYGVKIDALLQSFNLVSQAVIHCDLSEDFKKEVLGFDKFLNNLNLDIDTYFSCMLLINLISITEGYFVDIVKEILTLYPEKIGKEKLELKDVLCLTRDEIILSSAEKYIDGIMRKRPKEYLSEIGKILSIGEIELTEDWKKFIEAKARRDIGVHNNWIINETYKRKIEEIGIQDLPSSIIPDFNYIHDLCKFCLRIVDDIRKKIDKKYS